VLSFSVCLCTSYTLNSLPSSTKAATERLANC
jgi:hypothetical protein